VFHGKEFKEKYPYIRFDDPLTGVLDPTAGVVMADKALQAVQLLAVRGGAVIRDGVSVDSVDDWRGGVRVGGQGPGGREEYTAQSVVICPGPWAGPLLESLGVSLPLTPMKIPVYYWRAPDFLPHTFIFEDVSHNHIWGLPPLEYPGLAKICLHEGPTVCPDTRDGADTQYIKTLLQEFIRKHFPGVEPEVCVEESCMYTVTADWNPVIDSLPGNRNIVIAAGFSGTGFKLGPVTGRMVADLAQGRQRGQQEQRLGLARFQTGGKL